MKRNEETRYVRADAGQSSYANSRRNAGILRLGWLVFAAVNAFVDEAFAAEQKIRFPYGNSYGWCAAHYVGKKLICNVFAERDAFTVMVRLSNKQFDTAYSLVSADSQRCIDHKYPCGDGGWLHYRVTNEEQMGDVQTLLQCKKG